MSLSVRHRPDGSAEVTAEISVGIETRQVTVLLGRYEEPVNPGGLRNMPVVVLPDAGWVDIVRTGVRRAGRATVAVVDLTKGGVAGAELLRAASGAEVVLVVVPRGLASPVLIAARALEGRPLPVVPLGDDTGVRAMLQGCDIDLDVAVPSVDGPTRDLVRGAAERLGLFLDHHVVEVDPRPAFSEADDTARASLPKLTAASAGVLAGRIAAGNRRWR
ncbi:MAG TPA: hypothetical protein VF351_06310 [Actinomycetota bacterium]